MEDFTGIKFNGVHSSSLGLVRVSSGDRYENGLIPAPSITSTDVPGDDGSYYYGATFKTRDFSLDFAFDNVTENQLRLIGEWCAHKKLAPLIFDEYPYKQYYACVSTQPSFKFICFDNKDGRVYKGELSVKFTAYYPLAVVREKDLDCYNYGDYPNKDDWSQSSRLITNYGDKLMDQEQKLQGSETNVHYFRVCNPGDAATGYKLTMYKPSASIPLTYIGKTDTTITGKAWTNDDMWTIQNNLIGQSKSYTCFIDNTDCDLTLRNGAYYCTTTNADYVGELNSRYFVRDGSISKEYYKIYENVLADARYSFQGPVYLGIPTGTPMYLNLSGKSYPIGVMEHSTPTFQCYFSNEIPLLTAGTSTAYIGPRAAKSFSVKLEHTTCTGITVTKASFDLVFPPSYNVPLEELNSAQLANIVSGYVEVDTNKQSITYFESTAGARVGLMGILQNGSLFKLPVINEDDTHRLVIKTNGFSFGNPASTLSYPYYFY